MSALRRLWYGDLPLADAFWNWAVIGGLVVNIATSIAFYGLLLSDWTVPALIVGYGVSLPYNLVVSVGVWRSADRHPGSRGEADAARIVTVVAMIVLSVT